MSAFPISAQPRPLDSGFRSNSNRHRSGSRSSPFLGWGLFLGSGIASQVAAALATKTYGDVGAAPGAGLTFVFAAALALAIRRPPTRDWSPTRWRVSAALGLLIVTNVILLYASLAYLPLGTAVTIEFLGPLGVAVYHARRFADYLAAGFAIGGVALVSAASVSGSLIGVALSLGGGACWAFYIFASRRAGAYERPADSLIVAVATGALVSIPLAIEACSQISDLRTLELLVAVALVGRTLPYGFEILALQRISAGSAGILFSIVPAIAAVTGFLLLGQPFSAPQFLGLAIVVLAGTIVARDGSAG